MIWLAMAAAFEIFDLRSAGDPALAFAAVFDAGSTGTRINVCGFDRGRLAFYYVEMLRPGVAALLNYEIAQHLRFLLANAHARLRRFGFDAKAAPVAFLATAGLRLLPQRAAQKIIDEARAFLSAYNARDVRVITGAEEGVLALESLALLKIAEHAALQRLGCAIAVRALGIDSARCAEIAANGLAATYGIVDMGGGSVQIAYATRKKLVSRSLLGFGMNESLRHIKNHPNYAQCRSAAPHSAHCSAVFADLFRKAPRQHARGIARVREIFLTSFFFDTIATPGASVRKSFAEIRSDFARKCDTLSDEHCLKTKLLVLLLSHVGFTDSSSFFLVDKVAGINLSWSIAVAHRLVTQ